MSEFAVGQRWVSQSESSLGLGIIVDVENRRVRISFPVVGEERLYAIQTAPLTRIDYKPGEMIRTGDEHSYQVTRVESCQGRLLYHAVDKDGKEHKIDELELDCFIELSSPKQRLTSGQLDPLRAYQLRCQTLLQLDRLQRSAVRGLLGSRTSLLPHQTYIAYEVAGRYAPRVLLADEVGLGKTIEAGMILHYQLHTGLADRVLIIVPETLTHQWLVEMLRRFNLRFSLFNKDRIGAASAEAGNPFESEQLIICSLDNVTGDPDMFKRVLAADWDLVVVDEAHHLHWSDGDAGHDYRCIERLADQSRGLLLLTATPEQAGVSSHFARLRLLDPARFHDLDEFLDEEQGYRQLNDTVRLLLDKPGAILADDSLSLLKTYLDDEVLIGRAPGIRQRAAMVNKLLDRHGTGRVFFRNTRAAIKGFPERKLIPYPLAGPELYASLSGKQTLFPETEIVNDDWLKADPRVQCLIDLLKQLKPEKVLVICANAKTATTLEDYLQLRAGLRSAAFYEGLSIIRRDRAAAYFADPEQGAQVLVCSEIGSEGRNFQFAHHLVLFDLPLNPDLLEQRIGRLDRIGQSEIITIHVPYIEHSAQSVLFAWYNEGLNIFNESCAAAFSIFEKFGAELNAALEAPGADIAALLKATGEHVATIKQAMRDGRDRLIELNSCRKDIAENIIHRIKQEENPESLMNYLETLLDTYGVDHEQHSEHTWILHPSDQMRLGYFPGLGDDSITVTFDREQALTREDFSFISWEHPMLAGAMEMVINSELGNACITTIAVENIEPGTILLETYSSIKIIAPGRLQVERFLPITPGRTLIGKDRKNYAEVLSHAKLNELSMPIDTRTAHAIIKQIKGDLETMIEFAAKYTDLTLSGVKQAARQRVNTLLGSEIERLGQLKKKNANIRDEETEFLQDQLHACTEAINNATYELQALRLVIVQ